MRILMAISANGYTAQGPDDRMAWTGRHDKQLFRALTMVDGGFMLAGTSTYTMMLQNKKAFGGRSLFQVSTKHPGITLEDYHNRERRFQYWLIGGQTVALAALRKGFVTEVHLSRVHHEVTIRNPDYEDAIRDWLIKNWGNKCLEAVTVHGPDLLETWHL